MATKLTAEKRNQSRKSATKKLRREGKIPAILYGNDTENQSVTVEEGDLTRIFRDAGKNGVINLVVNGSSPVSVMAYEIQYDSLKGNMTHVDFLAVDMDSEIETEVPLSTTGEAKGEKDGGVVQHALNEFTVSAKPDKIPSYIEVDITELDIGDSLYVKDVKGYDDIKIMTDEEEVVVAVIPPSTNEEAEESEEDEDAEPEVIQDKGEEDSETREQEED